MAVLSVASSAFAQEPIALTVESEDAALPAALRVALAAELDAPVVSLADASGEEVHVVVTVPAEGPAAVALIPPGQEPRLLRIPRSASRDWLAEGLTAVLQPRLGAAPLLLSWQGEPLERSRVLLLLEWPMETRYQIERSWSDAAEAETGAALSAPPPRSR